MAKYNIPSRSPHADVSVSIHFHLDAVEIEITVSYPLTKDGRATGGTRFLYTGDESPLVVDLKARLREARMEAALGTADLPPFELEYLCNMIADLVYFQRCKDTADISVDIGNGVLPRFQSRIPSADANAIKDALSVIID